MRIERSRRRSSCPPRLEPSTRSPSDTLASAPHSARPARLAAWLSAVHSEAGSAGGILVEPDEIADGHRELCVAVGIERIDAQRVLETRDDDRHAERIEPRI